MKKLLLGMIALLSFTMTSNAACTTDVNMSGNQIKDLGVGSADGDAVNYGQVLKQTQVTVSFNNETNVTGQYGTTFTVLKVGSMCQINASLKSTGNIANSTSFATIPAGFRPRITTYLKSANYNNMNQMVSYIATNGAWSIENYAPPTPLSYHRVTISYLCN